MVVASSHCQVKIILCQKSTTTRWMFECQPYSLIHSSMFKKEVVCHHLTEHQCDEWYAHLLQKFSVAELDTILHSHKSMQTHTHTHEIIKNKTHINYIKIIFYFNTQFEKQQPNFKIRHTFLFYLIYFFCLFILFLAMCLSWIKFIFVMIYDVIYDLLIHIFFLFVKKKNV